MSLRFRIFICSIVSSLLTIAAIYLDRGTLFLPTSRLLIIFGASFFIYTPTLYAAFLSEGKVWTKNTVSKFFKSLAISAGMITLGLSALYLQSQAYNSSLTINWFGFIWLLLLFSGLSFNKTPKDNNLSAV